LSEIRATTISDETGSGPIALTKQSAAKAWAAVQTNTGSHVLAGSFNISSTVDLGTGYGTLNLSSSMSDVNYSAISAKQNSVNNNAAQVFFYTGSTASQVRFSFFESGGTLVDPYHYVGTVHGDLA
tara:strand:+ start:3986 stop:4363 length:378 start_codon:yes stop_codon:yes gene_type:complete